MRRPFFYRLSHGVRISVVPRFLPEQSNPALRRYVFIYHVRIEQIGHPLVQLVSRRWLISDSIGEDLEVVGDGVVGQQPILRRGDFHEYESYCILKSPRGAMEGYYRFVVVGNPEQGFDAQIPRFELDAESYAEGSHP